MQNNFISSRLSIVTGLIKNFIKTENKIEFSEVETITLGEVLTEDFIIEFTSFYNFDHMIESSKLKNKYISYKNLFMSNQWSNFVGRVTQFDCWNDMVETAIKYYTFKNNHCNAGYS